MYGPIHTEENGGYTIKIYPDTDAQNPRKESDQLGTLVTFGRSRHLGDAHNFESPDEFVAFAKREKLLVLPVYKYEHSTVALSTSTFVGRAHHAEWDSGQIGYIYVSREDARHNFMCRRLTKQRVQTAFEVLSGEIETYGGYLNGDVYEYVIENDEGDIVDSCCGCYGYQYTIDEANGYVNGELASEVVAA